MAMAGVISTLSGVSPMVRLLLRFDHLTAAAHLVLCKLVGSIRTPCAVVRS